MNRRVLKAILPALVASMVAAGLWAQEKSPQPTTQKLPSVDEIVHKTNYVAYYQGKDGRAQVLMTIVDGQGNKRQREMTILRWDQPRPAAEGGQPRPEPSAKPKDDDFTGEQKFYVYFRSPHDVAKTAFLVWKHLDKDDDRWLYQPALDNVDRVAATDKRTSFVGSHFLYEDVSGRNVNDDKHELVKATRSYYVLKNTPKKPESVEFGHFEMWIHRESFVVVRTVYYDRQGKKYRTYEAKKVETIQGFPTVTAAKMSDEKIGGHTLLEYKQVKYNVGVPEKLFSERFLKRTPYKYLE